jgi:hypothetical protein
MPTYPSVDESRDRLHRAGWSMGEIGCAPIWVVLTNEAINDLIIRTSCGIPPN